MQPSQQVRQRYLAKPETKERMRNYQREYTKRPEVIARLKEYYKSPKYLAHKHAYYISNKGRTRKYLRKYDLTAEQFDEILCEQGGCCAICKREPEVACPQRPFLVIDHDHQTNKIRGLLCGTCNTGLGMFGDNWERIYDAGKYLLVQNLRSLQQTS